MPLARDTTLEEDVPPARDIFAIRRTSGNNCIKSNTPNRLRKKWRFTIPNCGVCPRNPLFSSTSRNSGSFSSLGMATKALFPQPAKPVLPLKPTASLQI